MTRCHTRRSYLNIIFAALLLLLLLAGAGSLQARQFRLIQPIATPDTSAISIPDGAREVAVVEPITREQLEPHLQKLLEAWGSGQLSGQLADDFWDKQRLLDTLDIVVPRDANLRLQSIQGVQTLSQYLQPDADTGRDQRISIVSATARTQLEFNDPQAGFVRRPGINEFILKVTESAAP